MPKPKRVNKTKDQVAAEMAHFQRVERDKSLVKLIFPFIENQKTIYDAQTVVGALSGFIKVKLDQKTSEFKVKDLAIDLSNETESDIKTAIINLVGLLEPENAKDTTSLLERLGNVLAQYSANEFMKQPMNIVTADKIIAG